MLIFMKSSQMSCSVCPRIKADIADAFKELSKQWSTTAGIDGLNDSEATALARIEIAIADYIDLLCQVERLRAGTIKKRIAYVTARLLDTPEARIVAMVRSFAKCGQTCLPLELLKKAYSFSVWQPLTETVRVYWKPPQASGKFRPICVFGPIRRAQGLMVRDMLLIAGVDISINYATKGSGGERGLVKKVCSFIDEGKDWWWTPDIKAAFPSIHPGHLSWLAMDRRLLLNVAYLPKCAKIEIKLPNDAEKLSAYLKKAYPGLLGNISLTDITKLLVRQGLPQGSVLSPLLAGVLIAHIWSQSNPVPKAVMLSWHDDLHIGAQTKAQLKQVKEKLTLSMASLLAGPIEFHESPVLAANSRRVTALGYILQPMRGHIYLADGSRSIHVKLGGKRIQRYKKRLAKRLSQISDAETRLLVTETYTKQWFNSQTAWTKVPEFSWMIAENCGIIYLTEFEAGQPMGGGWIN